MKKIKLGSTGAEKQMDKFMERLVNKKKIRRKVVCVFGKFDDKSDFVLEPAIGIGEEKDAFWIEGEEEK